MSEQAKRAYEAYAKVVGRNLGSRLTGDLTGDTIARMNTWEDLPPHYREAWRDAVAAALDDPEPKKETTADVQVRLLDEMGTAKLGRQVKAMMPPGRGFMLWTVDHGPGGTLAYVSTIKREDAIRSVREWLKHQGAL